MRTFILIPERLRDMQTYVGKSENFTLFNSEKNEEVHASEEI